MQTKSIENIQIPFMAKEAKSVTFDNGFTFIFVPKKGEVFNINTWVKTGSIHEDDEINGISHFLEHLMFKGTERFGPGEFDHKMESMGAIINAATWKDFTYYYVTGPQGVDSENFDTALDMHADMLLYSTLPDDEIGPAYDHTDKNYDGPKRERTVVIEEINMRLDQPWTKVFNQINDMMYPEGHPYKRDVIGTPDIIANVPRSTLMNYYRAWYSPQNMTTVVVGDVDFEETLAKIQNSFDFGKVPKHDVPEGDEITDLAEFALPDYRFHRNDCEYQTAFMMIGFHGPPAQDLQETVALDVVSYVLGEGKSARLPQELIEKKEQTLFNALITSHMTFKLGSVFFVQANMNTHDHEPVLAQVNGELEKLLNTEPITADELKRAVKKLKVEFAETSETASGISETIGDSITVMGNLDYYTKYLDILENLTADQVNEAAKTYLSLDKAYTAILAKETNNAQN